MKLTWLGHSGFRLQIEQAVILIDPWFSGNPVFPDDRRAEAIDGATHILITHGHGDHTGDTLALAKELKIPVVGIFDLIGHWEKTDKIEGIGFNKGGTVDLGGAQVTMVNATHSSSISGPDGPVYAGHESGYMIAGDGHVIYVSGDTDIMADMEWMGDLHKPDIGILCAGGHFTMDMSRAAYAAKRYFDFKTVIPCHYKTFPLLEQSAQVLIDALPGVDVIEPKVMEAVAL
ncbi:MULTISPECIES: metal-dependent hydrolase [unclassified Paracoccus (in: a-proteobacteria)]|uniref:metal-dependent hydrolase n=1 Tax=unclassified Paracoccus (in: a-proteobacteria) TaxID=2688777 RepID=UPI0011E76781|nr:MULTISPECIES: metal-dependent hydrolase [unclassified Paracoccus (in: a-proteobacteria)]MCO6363307.1 metal-dependent hydrolase [Paracoccus sp. 08]TYP67266.1 L-ascorbate metabolism protein UlaG (beta-lactamase superfamily) [Stutzerimonas stutzeri]